MIEIDVALVLDCRGKPLRLDRPRIMGILNATPDSFSDGGAFVDATRALVHAERMIEEGADLIDVGGESTRPGAEPVTAEQEIARVLPIVEKLAGRVSVPISIDTSKPEVMRAAVGAGAGLVNCVRALREPHALETVAELKVPACLMHMQGEPRTMQQAPEYEDVVQDVKRFLADRVLASQFAGIDKKNLLIDPGFGFGKTFAQNCALLRDLSAFKDIGLPILVGLSRKAMIGEATGRVLGERAVGSAAAALIAVQHGAQLVRVHDVGATKDALAVWQAAKLGDNPRGAAAKRKFLVEDDD